MKQRTKEAFLWTVAAASSIATFVLFREALTDLDEAKRIDTKNTVVYSLEDAERASQLRIEATIELLGAASLGTAALLVGSFANDGRQARNNQQDQAFVDVDCLPN
jgi:hypothetical protein